MQTHPKSAPLSLTERLLAGGVCIACWILFSFFFLVALPILSP